MMQTLVLSLTAVAVVMCDVSHLFNSQYNNNKYPRPYFQDSRTTEPQQNFQNYKVSGHDHVPILNQQQYNNIKYPRPYFQDSRVSQPQENFQNYKVSGHDHVPILSQQQYIEPSGSYQWRFSTANGIKAEEMAFIKELDAKETMKTVKGSYQYTSPDGVPILVTYTADENGFQPQVITQADSTYDPLPDFYKQPIKQ